MARAVAPFHPAFITPMAAVAETILTAIAQPEMPKAYANNGGAIALHLAPGETLSAAIGLGPRRITISAADPSSGVATSGWRGRSLLLGIPESVTVLAQTASTADAAATMIANAVDLPGHVAIQRRPTREIQPDNDLAARLVTVSVGQLTQAETASLLDRGIARASDYQQRGLIHAAALFLNSDLRTTGAVSLKEIANA